MTMQLHNPKFSPKLSLWIYYVLICLASYTVTDFLPPPRNMAVGGFAK